MFRVFVRLNFGCLVIIHSCFMNDKDVLVYVLDVVNFVTKQQGSVSVCVSLRTSWKCKSF